MAQGRGVPLFDDVAHLTFDGKTAAVREALVPPSIPPAGEE